MIKNSVEWVKAHFTAALKAVNDFIASARAGVAKIVGY